ncbi:hypothetical protein PGT21_000348 [Puccinia graminis f. sp. tritici]|uniref:Uncharacterized protein n=1 Tax=Puccinia graminis f. sp. tritici TaxID=56615 RepID=A0A5B0NK38_PUCGR|nr:hypothetical protein PGT21_000348 [Puccinia graminis f. sp. tritici]
MTSLLPSVWLTQARLDLCWTQPNNDFVMTGWCLLEQDGTSQVDCGYSRRVNRFVWFNRGTICAGLQPTPIGTFFHGKDRERARSTHFTIHLTLAQTNDDIRFLFQSYRLDEQCHPTDNIGYSSRVNGLVQGTYFVNHSDNQRLPRQMISGPILSTRFGSGLTGRLATQPIHQFGAIDHAILRVFLIRVQLSSYLFMSNYPILVYFSCRSPTPLAFVGSWVKPLYRVPMKWIDQGLPPGPAVYYDFSSIHLCFLLQSGFVFTLSSSLTHLVSLHVEGAPPWAYQIPA